MRHTAQIAAVFWLIGPARGATLTCVRVPRTASRPFAALAACMFATLFATMFVLVVVFCGTLVVVVIVVIIAKDDWMAFAELTLGCLACAQ